MLTHWLGLAHSAEKWLLSDLKSHEHESGTQTSVVQCPGEL